MSRFITKRVAEYPEYFVYRQMIHRCHKENDSAYADDGGRNIVVSVEWSTFDQFYRDMGPRPTVKHTLDRIDSNGPYCKNNCRWATRRQQARNKRNTRLFTLDGKSNILSDWATELGVSRNTLLSRTTR